MFHEYCANRAEKKNEKIIVQRKAPIKPSQVLLGERARKGAEINFLPKVIPTKYAETSFIMTFAIGKKNQKMPLSVFDGKYLHWKTTKQTVTTDHIC
jgi:hypothetical protein